jgi:hypothetical protein
MRPVGSACLPKKTKINFKLAVQANTKIWFISVMDPYPAPSRGRGRSRGRGTAARGKRGDGRGRGRDRGGAVGQGSPKLPGNHDRYDHHSAEDDSSSEEGIDFESTAAAGFQSETLDGGKSATMAEDIVGGELAADFSNLASVLRSAPLWIRLGSDEAVRIALGDERTKDRAVYFRHETNAAHESGVGVVQNREIASSNLLQAFDNTEINEPVSGLVPAVESNNDDDFDAWLDKA